MKCATFLGQSLMMNLAELGKVMLHFNVDSVPFVMKASVETAF